jgi:hypothetical protein
MSDDNESKRRPGLPKYFYWARKPPELRFGLQRKPPVNREQRRLLRLIFAFRILKLLAIAVFISLVLSRV